MDHAAFERFIDFMKEAYHVHETMERMGGHGYTLLYKWHGRDTTRAPSC